MLIRLPETVRPTMATFFWLIGTRNAILSCLQAYFFSSGSDDGLNLFHSNESSVCLDPNTPTVITVYFIPLKLTPRHCSIVLSSPDHGDIVISVTALVNNPLPTLPELLHPCRSTIVNVEARTIHFNTTSNLHVEENVIIHSSNVSLENALLEISKWELSDSDLKRRVLTESLHYKALSSGITLDFLELSGNEAIVFTIEGSDNEHFVFPDQVTVPTISSATGIM